MGYYETGPLNWAQKNHFLSQFDMLIGTETEETKHGENEYTILCCELSQVDVTMCREIERSVNVSLSLN